ncbi:transcriptional regulator, DeoR family [Gracilibacillus ureilyticus]|uniref:Transcriptional regulator, DeoR family n=1 Tax=Gracilibacillus ureilyticus TaxID=531814 RepID=A0A1H9UKU4_9BACI|nr:DeoR/GlpR family DNA-binding transcription regulator [Gracilibacillus ureilyticus]SES10160.1 transcriptional regulator, DeoR family [Gracilibacillus ureilyticus]
MLLKDRQSNILAKLDQFHSIRVADLVKEYNVSVETIRRDLEYLESVGKLKRVHGGAILEKENKEEKSFIARETLNVKEKQELAEIAAQFVQEGQSIAMDVSTTNTEFAKVLKKKFNQLTILTNSLPIAYELSTMPHYSIIIVGGILRNEELCVVGDMTEQFISQFHIDTLFLSMSGISLHSGLTDYGIREWNVKRQLLEASNKCYVLADSSKFDAVSLLKVCSFNEIDAIITDSSLSTNIIDNYKQAGITIINS